MHMSRDGRDEPDELLALHHTDTSVPVLDPSRWLQSPSEELRRVVEPEHVVVILDVVLVQEQIEFLQLQGESRSHFSSHFLVQ